MAFVVDDDDGHIRVASHDGKSVIDRNTGKKESAKDYGARKERDRIEKEVRASSGGGEDAIAAAQGVPGYTSVDGPAFEAGQGCSPPGPVSYNFGVTKNGASGPFFGNGYADPNGAKGTLGVISIKGATKGAVYLEGEFKAGVVDAALGIVDDGFKIGAKADGLTIGGGAGFRLGEIDLNLHGSLGFQAGGSLSVGKNNIDFDISAVWGGEIHARW